MQSFDSGFFNYDRKFCLLLYFKPISKKKPNPKVKKKKEKKKENIFIPDTKSSSYLLFVI